MDMNNKRYIFVKYALENGVKKASDKFGLSDKTVSKWVI